MNQHQSLRTEPPKRNRSGAVVGGDRPTTLPSRVVPSFFKFLRSLRWGRMDERLAGVRLNAGRLPAAAFLDTEGAQPVENSESYLADRLCKLELATVGLWQGNYLSIFGFGLHAAKYERGVVGDVQQGVGEVRFE